MVVGVPLPHVGGGIVVDHAPPAGTFHVPSSRRYRVEPAVAPGSGTTPAAWLDPLGPNTGSRAALTVPLVIELPLTPPEIVVAFSVPTLIVPAVNAVGENVYDVPSNCQLTESLCGLKFRKS